MDVDTILKKPEIMSILKKIKIWVTEGRYLLYQMIKRMDLDMEGKLRSVF